VARLADDPFVKVRGILNDLVARLESDATAEQTQKSFCDTNMEAAITKRDERKAEMETLSTSIEATSAEIKELEDTIAALAEEVAALHRSIQEMTDLRNEEKALNAKTIEDADAGKLAVAGAIIALQNFYGTQFLQRDGYVPPNADREGKTVGDLAPKTFTGAYDGKMAESKSVIGLLEVISSDFERTSTSTAAAEATQESEYQTQKTSVETELGLKEASKEAEETSKTDKETALVGFKDSLKDETGLHATALTELEALKASCVDAAESYAERAARREQEIEGLKDALRILEDWKN
jgi:hypothetical protein